MMNASMIVQSTPGMIMITAAATPPTTTRLMLSLLDTSGREVELASTLAMKWEAAPLSVEEGVEGGALVGVMLAPLDEARTDV